MITSRGALSTCLPKLVPGLLLALASVCAVAQVRAAAPAEPLSEHVRKDITRHRAMAAAHEAAARCLEAGKPEAQCLKDLQATCQGLAIGKYCGMKHEH
jgi:hypothetical protein